MRLNLQSKYSLTIATIILLLISCLAGILLLQFQKSVSALTDASSQKMSNALMFEIQKRGETMVQLLAENLVNPLYQYDMQQIKALLKAAKKQQDISNVVVYNKKGNIIHDGTKDILLYGQPVNANIQRAMTLGNETLLFETDDKVLTVSLPIYLQDKPLGGISLGLSLESIQNQIGLMGKKMSDIEKDGTRQNLIALIIITCSMLIIGAVISVFASRHLTRPIKEVASYAAHVGRGDYDFTITNSYHGEIKDLVTEFEKMKSNLRKTTISKEDLEMRVKERTKDLAEINDVLQVEIHERKSAEQRLTKYQDQLEEKINERTFELKQANKQLVLEIDERKHVEEKRAEIEEQLLRAQKMEVVGRLAGGVAHDLNNILSGIVSYPDLILMDLSPDSPLKRPLETIRKSGNKASAIVQDLLTMARRNVSISEMADLNEILSEYLKSPEHEKIMEYHSGIHVEVSCEHGLLPILGSPVHLSKTIMNLVSNAAEAISHDGRIRISLQNQYVDTQLFGYDQVKEGDYVTLSISDTGTGIAKNDIGHIFEPFYTKKSMGRSGTGLGMTVVWGTVKDHHGYIDVKSLEGSGTTFSLYFPVCRDKVTKNLEGITLETYIGNGESILIVDDVEEQREIAGRMLERLGYHVVSVASGEQAIDLMGTISPDLILLDMIMSPGIDGLETYEKIIVLRPNQKAIITSGYSESERVKQVQDLGAGAYVKKPYTIETIAVAIWNEFYG